MRLLIVESNSSLADRLFHKLSWNFCVDLANNADQALYSLATNEYQIVIADFKLIDPPALDLISEICDEKNRALLLVIGPTSNPEQICSIFNAGADEFMAQPIVIKELIARSQALLRRVNQPLLPKQAQVGNFSFDYPGRKLFYQQTVIPLNRKEALIMECLMRHLNQVIPPQNLWMQVWEQPLPNYNSLQVYISRLRKKIGNYTHNTQEQLIKTVRGFGYEIPKINYLADRN